MQGCGETKGLEEAKAKASGASELFIADLREEFVRDYIFPCLRAGAVYERKYLLGTSMARPIIAKVMLCKLSLGIYFGQGVLLGLTVVQGNLT